MRGFEGRYGMLRSSLDSLAAAGEKSLRWLDLGTHDGGRVRFVLEYWLSSPGHSAVYRGLDFFSPIPRGRQEEELIGSRLPPKAEVVRAGLASKLRKYGGRCRVKLRPGDIRETVQIELADYMGGPVSALPNLILIDGGRSLQTVSTSFLATSALLLAATAADKPCDLIMANNFRGEDGFGCGPLVRDLDTAYSGFYLCDVGPYDPVDRQLIGAVRIRGRKA